MLVERAGASRTRRARRIFRTRPLTLVVPFAAGGGIDVDRPHPGPAHGRIARPERRRREYRRRRRDGGRRAGRPGGARRLHVRDRQCGHPRLQPDALQEAALQCGDRLHAGRARDRVAAHPDHPQGPAGQATCRSSSPTSRPTRARCSSARPASAPARTCPACCSTSRSGSTSRTCPIGARRRPCRT